MHRLLSRFFENSDDPLQLAQDGWVVGHGRLERIDNICDCTTECVETRGAASCLDIGETRRVGVKRWRMLTRPFGKNADELLGCLRLLLLCGKSTLGRRCALGGVVSGALLPIRAATKYKRFGEERRRRDLHDRIDQMFSYLDGSTRVCLQLWSKRRRTCCGYGTRLANQST